MNKLLNFIYSKKDEGIYRTYRIFGIKIITKPIRLKLDMIEKNIQNVSNRSEDLYFYNLKNIFNEKMLNILSLKDYSILNEEIYNYWFRMVRIDNFLDLLYLISKRSNIWDKINPNFWLVYISSLYEQNNFDLAQDILIKYIEKHKFLNIHNFLLVCKLSKELNIVNEEIEKSAFIIKKLDESIQNKIFENTINGKSVAVVGNGPQELGKGKGYEIDSHDIVIRFNNFNTNGFEKDYGSKTDILIRNGSIELKDINRQFNKICIWEPDFYHFLTPQHILDRLYEDIVNSKFQTTYLNYEMHNIPKIESGVKNYNLMSGTLIIYFLYKINKISINDIYGFSFIKDDFDSNSYHYYSDTLNNGGDVIKYHEINKEILFLRKLFNVN